MADILPPPPIDAPFMSYGWIDWYKKVRDAINQSQIEHNKLSGLQGGNDTERYHFTAAEHANLALNSTGDWTATLSNTSNITSSTWNAGQYVRLGDRVICFGSLRITVTTAGPTQTAWELSLPVASNFTLSSDLLIFGGSRGSTLVSGFAETTNNTGYFTFLANFLGDYNLTLIMIYKVL